LERTRLIFDNLHFFETNPSLQMANRILLGIEQDFSVDRFLSITTIKNGTPEQIEKCSAVDNYLNFLWRIAYANSSLGTVTLGDLDAFGYYFYLISQNVGLMFYCIEEGFEEIIDAIAKLKPVWDATAVENVNRRKIVEKWAAAETSVG